MFEVILSPEAAASFAAADPPLARKSPAALPNWSGIHGAATTSSG
jgi:hypothetical protein